MKGRVELTGNSPFLSFKVDGEPVYATSVDIHADAKSIPTVTVKLDLLEEVEVAFDANVLIPEHTRQALLALGWTPPEGTEDAQQDPGSPPAARGR